jgi:serine/threonine protein kinase
MPADSNHTESPPHVFISHSSRDAATALAIAHALEAAGVPCWIAPRDIPAGANYNAAIMNGISSSRALLFLSSRDSVASDPVAREVERAVSKPIPVISIRLDQTPLTPALEILVATYQWVTAYPSPIDSYLMEIVGAVKRALRLAEEAPKPNPEAPPKYVGPYRILEQLGEGGMGTVYKAEQRTPIKRTVALKAIKLGMATKEILARFNSERQALARMDSPNIAKVLDAGSDDRGQPYFVMEYVPGVPITQFADDKKLSIKQRLELFLQVCSAVGHAHTKAILHRDIKASNVLAYLDNGQPVVKVIDFGIAKALTGDKLTDRTFNTERGFVVGTYEAMSPEQAEGSPDIDTRTDVYSLGVLLYELLTGVKPFDAELLAKSADQEIRRMIREVEPPRPSTRVSALGASGAQVAAARRAQLDALAKELRSELEWIPLMAMRKERDRRYASPLDLAEDIQNYLVSRPLKAGPESLGYRCKKLVRRNRAMVLSGAVGAVLVFAAIVAYINGIRAEQHRTISALGQVRQEQRKTKAALAETEEQRNKAVETCRLAILALENTPGINRKQANLVKSRLRMQLLDQLRQAHKEHPDNHVTIQNIAQMLLDEGREAVSATEYTRAEQALVEAQEWLKRQPLDSAAAAEAFVDVVLNQSLVHYNVSGRDKSLAFVAQELPRIHELAARFPDSWRIQYLLVRIDNVRAVDNPSRHEMSRLADKLNPVIDKSQRAFEPVLWRFVLKHNEFWNESASDYAALQALAVWYREQLLGDSKYSVVQTEEAAIRFTSLLRLVVKQFSLPNDESSAESRRSLLRELETSMAQLETRLPRSLIVYDGRGELLRLQDLAAKDGVSTQSPDALRVATERHRIVASALGIGSSVAETIGPAFKSYLAEGASDEAKAKAVTDVQNTIQDFMALDLAGANAVLSHSDIKAAAAPLEKSGGPLSALHQAMVQRYTELYQQANRDAKVAFLDEYAAHTYPAVASWIEAAEYDKVISFWSNSYSEIPLRTTTSGDKQPLIKVLNACIVAQLSSGRREDAEDLLADSLALCDAILTERPWDYYAKDAYFGLCFAVAEQLATMGDEDSAQPLLRRGWAVLLKKFGKEELLDRYPMLPLKGRVPVGASPEDVTFFESFGKDDPARKNGMKRFTIQIFFSGERYPSHVYIVPGPHGYDDLVDQFRWYQEIRGGTVPTEVQESFQRLHKIAVENKVDFLELCVYALGTSEDKANGESKLAANDDAVDAPVKQSGSNTDGKLGSQSVASEAGKDELKRVLMSVYGKLDSGKRFWTYVAVRPSKVEDFEVAQKSGKVDLYNFEEFGEIIVSGEGHMPPVEVVKKVAMLFQIDPDVLESRLLATNENTKSQFDAMVSAKRELEAAPDRQEVLLRVAETAVAYARALDAEKNERANKALADVFSAADRCVESGIPRRGKLSAVLAGATLLRGRISCRLGKATDGYREYVAAIQHANRAEDAQNGLLNEIFVELGNCCQDLDRSIESAQWQLRAAYGGNAESVESLAALYASDPYIDAALPARLVELLDKDPPPVIKEDRTAWFKSAWDKYRPKKTTSD